MRRLQSVSARDAGLASQVQRYEGRTGSIKAHITRDASRSIQKAVTATEASGNGQYLDPSSCHNHDAKTASKYGIKCLELCTLAASTVLQGRHYRHHIVL